MSLNILDIADNISRNERMTRDAIIKELMHHDLLRALIKSPLGRDVVFQGGTALRLCYGNPRYSEDLDFARYSDKALDPASVDRYEQSLKRNLETHYHDMQIKIKPPKKPVSCRTEYGEVLVHKWSITAEIDGLRPDEKRPLIKIEIADVPAHTIGSRMLMNHYQSSNFQSMALPINVQSTHEIMADKIMAMMGRPRLQFRDVWDIHWLESRGVGVNYKFIEMKFRDYFVSDSQDRVNKNKEKMVERIDFLQTAEGHKKFTTEMRRFLGGDLRLWLEPTHAKNMINSVVTQLEAALKEINTLDLVGPLEKNKSKNQNQYESGLTP